MKKIFSAIMASLMLISVFSGCAKDNNSTPDGVNEKDFAENVVAIAGDYEITMDDMEIYIDLIVPLIQRAVGSSEGWDQTVLQSGLTARDELIDAAIEECCYQMAFVDYAIEQGLYSEEQRASYKTEYIEGFGGEEVLNEYLGEYGFNRESFEKYVDYMGAYVAVTDQFCSDEDAAEIFDEEYITAKHILVLFEGRESEEVALNEANSIYKRAAAGENFEALVNEFNEDPGQDAETGYTFTDGKMVDEFYNGAKSLKVGAISEPVKTTYGYHIIKRYENPTEDSEHYEEYITSIKSNESNAKITELYNGIMEEHPISINESILSSIDLSKYTVVSDENVNYVDGAVFDE